MNNIERQNIECIADIMRIVYQINELKGSLIVNIALNNQEFPLEQGFQMHMYKGNECYVKIIDLSTNPQKASKELFRLQSDLLKELILAGGDNEKQF